MRARGNERRPSPPIEAHERRDQPVELRGLEAALAQDLLEHPAIIEAAHDDQPIDDRPGTAERKTARRDDQRRDANVDIRGKPAVETELGPARRLATLQRGEVQIGKANRLLELVDFVTGKKHPRHVGLAADQLGNGVRIGLRPAEERHLVGKRRLVCCSQRGIAFHDRLPVHRSISRSPRPPSEEWPAARRLGVSRPSSRRHRCRGRRPRRP